MRKFTAVLGVVVIAVAFFAAGSLFVLHTMAQTVASSTSSSQIDANNQEIAQLTQEINQYEIELSAIGANKKTLQDAINALNLQLDKIKAQVTITQRQINTSQIQIEQLGTDITTTKQTIAQEDAALGEDLQELQQSDDEPLILQLLSASDFSQVWDEVGALAQLQSSIESDVSSLQTQESNLTDSQQASQQKETVLVTQKKSLTSQQQTLSQTQTTKTQLLAETNAQESTYQQLLTQAESQLAGFSTFTTNAGGAGLLYNQTSCDAWGCYYNQRDAQWGNDELDGTQFLLKSDGCLVTSMAMVMTHYGYSDVTPVTINSNPSNFAAYYPGYLLFTISVDGMSATRKAAAIDGVLATGNPVIVGLYAYGGTHFVVFVSGSKGNYIMRDPYIPNGDDINFSSYYSMADIFGVSKVEITS